MVRAWSPVRTTTNVPSGDQWLSRSVSLPPTPPPHLGVGDGATALGELAGLDEVVAVPADLADVARRPATGRRGRGRGSTAGTGRPTSSCPRTTWGRRCRRSRSGGRAGRRRCVRSAATPRRRARWGRPRRRRATRASTPRGTARGRAGWRRRSRQVLQDVALECGDRRLVRSWPAAPPRSAATAARAGSARRRRRPRRAGPSAGSSTPSSSSVVPGSASTRMSRTDDSGPVGTTW